MSTKRLAKVVVSWEGGSPRKRAGVAPVECLQGHCAVVTFRSRQPGYGVGKLVGTPVFAKPLEWPVSCGGFSGSPWPLCLQVFFLSQLQARGGVQCVGHWSGKAEAQDSNPDSHSAWM